MYKLTARMSHPKSVVMGYLDVPAQTFGPFDVSIAPLLHCGAYYRSVCALESRLHILHFEPPSWFQAFKCRPNDLAGIIEARDNKTHVDIVELIREYPLALGVIFDEFAVFRRIQGLNGAQVSPNNFGVWMLPCVLYCLLSSPVRSPRY